MTEAGKASANPSVARSASWGLVAFAITVVVTFFQTPYILAGLGDARYGTWALIGQVTGYYGLLDFGTRGAIAHFVSRHLANDDAQAANRYASAGAAVLLLAGLTVLLTGGLLLWGFPSLFQVDGVSLVELRSALAVMLLVVAFTLPFDVAGAIISGVRRPEIGTVADTVLRVAAFGAIVLALRAGGGLLALALIQASARAASWLYLSWQAKRLFPGVSLRLRDVDRAVVREVFGYGSRSVAVNISSLVINRLDVVLVGTFVGVRSVTVYVLGQALLGYMSNFVSVITRSFTTHFSHHHARGDREALRTMYLTGSRAAGAAAAVLSALAIAFATPFLGLWVGWEYVSGSLGERADTVMVVLLLGQIPRMIQSISWQLLFGIREPGTLARLLSVEAAANLVCSLVFVQFFGMIGVAMGTVLPMLVTNLWRMPAVVSHRLGISMGEYVLAGPARGVTVGAATLAVGLLLTRGLTPSTWLEVMALGAAAGTFAGLGIWVLVLRADERRALVAKVRRRA